MAAPDTPGNRPPGGDGPPLRHPHNFNSFQFVSQLISATPPYLFNMTSPFHGNFFSDLLRRMAPRGPGQPPDAALQQHLRAALLAKGSPPSMPHLPPQLDIPLHRSHPLYEDKGLKRSLYSDGIASSDADLGIKRARMDDDRISRPAEALQAPLLMQPPFLHSPVPPPPDVLSPWAAHASLLRPQVPLPAHLPPPPIDPYRLLLDLRLAGQLRSFASGPPKDLPVPPPLPPSSNGSSVMPPLHLGRPSPVSSSRTAHEDTQPSSTSVLRGSDDRISAFHPPGREVPETSDEEGGVERRSHSSSSGCSNASKESLGTQYIFRHLTQIYRSIDGQREDGSKQPDSSSERPESPEDRKKNSQPDANETEAKTTE
ncbi:pollen-specific leucine-rich repeat extensin-like protein 2 [Hyalella azteca]|uniref:Pollen-specific leucine-rich repeat extensin-like protein 2 n=1 Tax=Hyalella azteca TaxID=294128 RepID=A0A979FHC4_HYAAZ|nr:pollen-specific leucine-rich repeat extensin-like protein 2 [Hyalella azteca]